jgi:hypothetical protein
MHDCMYNHVNEEPAKLNRDVALRPKSLFSKGFSVNSCPKITHLFWEDFIKKNVGPIYNLQFNQFNQEALWDKDLH